MKNETPQLMEIAEVINLTSLGRSTIYSLVKDGDFPRPVHLSARHSRWIRSEIVQYIKDKMGQREND